MFGHSLYFLSDNSDWAKFQYDLCMAFRLRLPKSLLVTVFIASGTFLSVDCT